MGAINSTIRNPGNDYSKPTVSFTRPIDQSYSVSSPIDQSYGHISKRRRLSVLKDSDILSRISLYPASSKPLREIHAPVRSSRFGSLSRTKTPRGFASFEVNSAERMGNCFGVPFSYNKVKNGAIKCLGLFGKDKEKLAIGINDGDKENLGDVSDDSRNELEKEYYRALDSEENKLKMVEKDYRFLDSYVRNANALGVSAHKRLYELANKRDEKLNSLGLQIGYTEQCLKRLHLFRPWKKDEQLKKDVVDECFVNLTQEEEAIVARALSNFNRRKVLVSHDNSNIDISGENLQCLRPGAWLNDEVINLYLELLKEREKREPQKFLKCHFFNTFFYKKIISNGYNFQAVRRWTTQRKLGYCLLDCEKIFVPIHKGVHWCLAIINKKDKKFQYLDSLGGVDSQVMSVLARYYVDEVKDKTGKDINVESWDEEFVTDLPYQENGFDCGMFMIKYVDFYSRDIGLCFNQATDCEGDFKVESRMMNNKEILLVSSLHCILLISVDADRESICVDEALKLDCYVM
ncbi:ubiquitin-like-specific protease esd4 [Phtheirospermum japonicum]|uniref:Ubiquitin-like-specific protease esd4 n=1 Tax=Phtheirospermum japonicum TaxID=374723 RepID=A0A830CLR2_9LAMI|nr:ubiquitin-like-specific protease esd4 [Phtheirospermum japonicum]